MYISSWIYFPALLVLIPHNINNEYCCRLSHDRLAALRNYVLEFISDFCADMAQAVMSARGLFEISLISPHLALFSDINSSPHVTSKLFLKNFVASNFLSSVLHHLTSSETLWGEVRKPLTLVCPCRDATSALDSFAITVTIATGFPTDLNPGASRISPHAIKCL